MSEEKRRRFEEDQLIQDYFQVLKELVSKKSVFDQQTGLVETAAYLKDVFLAAGAEVLVDDSY
ncbi:peptidase M20, partial [Streptococcus pyogenes]